jgi:translation initiation factor 3 subunit H
MLRSLREVQADDSVVGFYQATSLGAFFNQNLVEIQAIHQDKLRHGGVVIVHGTHHEYLHLPYLVNLQIYL